MTELIIVIAIIVIIVAVLLAVRAGRERKLEGRRTEAQELRETAQSHDQRAEVEQAEAARQAARAKKAQAEAEEKAAIARTEAAAAQERAQAAEHEGGLAREHHERARAIDPDTPDPRDDAGWDDSSHGETGHDASRDDAGWDDSHEPAGRPVTDDDTRLHEPELGDRGSGDLPGEPGRR